ncbi:MAG TPA: hypothetical protein VEY88_04475 [Archangium sp.]|nr:hypothetical protein [Archangium sp.]
MSWKEFKANVFVEPKTGFFIDNGDQRAEDERALRNVYDSMVVGNQGSLENGLAVYYRAAART